MELSRALQHNIVGSGADIKEVISNVETEIPKTDVKVGYQGIKGANGHEATIRLFPDAEAHCYKSFGDVFDAVDKGEITFGVLPVENSNAGSVSAVYDLILKHRFYIVGALDLPIDYCLGGLKQAEFSDIEKVWSHPQSLSQCADYIAKIILTLHHVQIQQLPLVMWQRKSALMLRLSAHTRRQRNTV